MSQKLDTVERHFVIAIFLVLINAEIQITSVRHLMDALYEPKNPRQENQRHYRLTVFRSVER